MNNQFQYKWYLQTTSRAWHSINYFSKLQFQARMVHQKESRTVHPTLSIQAIPGTFKGSPLRSLHASSSAIVKDIQSGIPASHKHAALVKHTDWSLWYSLPYSIYGWSIRRICRTSRFIKFCISITRLTSCCCCVMCFLSAAFAN